MVPPFDMFKRGFLNSDKGRQTISVEEQQKQKKALIEQVQQSEPDPVKVEKTEDGKTIYHYDPAKCVSIILLVSPRS